jgi:hypothetical protein
MISEVKPGNFGSYVQGPFLPPWAGEQRHTPCRRDVGDEYLEFTFARRAGCETDLTVRVVDLDVCAERIVQDLVEESAIAAVSNLDPVPAVRASLGWSAKRRGSHHTDGTGTDQFDALSIEMEGEPERAGGPWYTRTLIVGSHGSPPIDYVQNADLFSRRSAPSSYRSLLARNSQRLDLINHRHAQRGVRMGSTSLL